MCCVCHPRAAPPLIGQQSAADAKRQLRPHRELTLAHRAPGPKGTVAGQRMNGPFAALVTRTEPTRRDLPVTMDALARRMSVVNDAARSAVVTAPPWGGVATPGVKPAKSCRPLAP